MASCFCVRLGKETVKTLDFRHCNLYRVPEDILDYEHTLEELFLDSNDIRELPRDLFHCVLLKKLGVSDNELVTVPNAVASLALLEELDISKNGIVELPDNIKSCKNLTLVEVSVNPLGKLPEGFTQLLNLTQLYLNDTLLDYLPANFGRLTRLKVLELRENRLKALPKSISRLTELERLDLGQNSFREIPEVIGALTKLTEIWIDTNKVNQLPNSFGNLTALIYFDASCNRLEHLPSEMEHLENLTDLHLSKNFLLQLPDNIGKMSNLTTLKADNNQLSSLPHSIGGLVSLEELILSANDLEDLPPSIGLLRKLRHLNVDSNMLQSLPSELGSCSSITLLSLRGNYLKSLPDEMGRIAKLTVVNLSNNRLQCLPYSFTKLKNLQALWLSENQSKPLIPLQSECVDKIGTMVLTCFMFPQQPQDYDEDSYLSDGESFHQSVWEQERAKRSKIAFNVAESETEEQRNTARATTPYPKETIRPRFRMGVVATTPNGHIPSARRPNLAEKVVSSPQNQMEILPSKPTVDIRTGRRVRGRRELELDGIRIREAKVTRPRSPASSTITDSLHLFQADKEKRAKDKARIRRSSTAESDAEPTTPRGKGLFKKSKSDRAAHSDSEAIDPEWGPREGSTRRSLIIQQSSDQERASPLTEPRTPITKPPRHNGLSDPGARRGHAHQNGGPKQRADGGSRNGTLERRSIGDDPRMSGHERLSDDNLDRRRSSGGEDYSDGMKKRSRDVRYNDESLRRRSLNRNMNNGQSGHGGTPSKGRRTPNEWRGSYHRKSGYGTDPELEELYHSSENQPEQKPPRSHHSPPRTSGYGTDPDRRTPQSMKRNKNSKHHGSNNQVNNPYSGYGTDSEIMAYNGPFDYSEPEDDHRRTRSPQRTLERRTNAPKKPEHHREVAPTENVNGGGDDELKWAFPEFESNAGKGDAIRQEAMDKRQLSEEPRSGRHRPGDHPVAIGRIAMANAGLVRESHLKESEKGDLSSETESQQGLNWDISEILGSSSQMIKPSVETQGHSPQIYKPDFNENNADHNSKGAETEANKNLIASTPEDGKQSDSEAALKSRQVPELARRIESEMDTVTDQVNQLELAPGGDVNRNERPLPPYSKKRDPNSPLPPSPTKLHHNDSPVPAFVHRQVANPSPLPQYQQVRQRTESPLPPYRGRPTPKGHTPDSHRHGGQLHIVKRQSDNRPHNDPRPNVGQTPKRGAIPSYEEALSRRRESLGPKTPQSTASTPYEPKTKTENLRPEITGENHHDGGNRQKHSTTHSGHLNERRNNHRRRDSDDYDYADAWHIEPQTKDTDLQGQPHDRKTEYSHPGGESPFRNRQDRKGLPPSQDQPDSNANIYKSNPLQDHHDYVDIYRSSPSEHPPNHGSGRLAGNKRRHGGEDIPGKHEADVNKNASSGPTATPTYPATRDAQLPPYRKGFSSSNRDVRQQQYPTEQQQRRDSNYNGQPDSTYNGRRDTNHNIQDDPAYSRDARYSGQRTPVPHQEVTPASRMPPHVGEDHGSRRGSGDGNVPHAINDDNWRQHVLNKVSRKRPEVGDDYQTPVSVRRAGDSHKSTVQERRLHVLRARLQNEMRTSEGSTEDVFHSPSLPSRPPARPYHHTPPHPHQQPPPHPSHHTPPHPSHRPPPHAQQSHPYHHSSQDRVNDADPPSKDSYPNPHHQQHPTPDTIPTHHDPVKGAPPPSYHHPRDWSPPTQGHHPSQTLDQVNMQDLRRGTPPGSSGSSTTGGNGRSFVPSPSLQRRLHPYQPPYQPPSAKSQSPLPVRRADPEGIGGPKLIPLVIYKNPGLGFSITGGKNSPGNPYHPEDMGIFVTKVQPHGPADHRLVPGDKILEVNDQDFVDIDHEKAVHLLKTSNPVAMVISRET